MPEDPQLRPIRHVQSKDLLSSKVVSQPTVELEKRVENLQQSLAAALSRGEIQNIILKNQDADENVELYNFVYFNTSTEKYSPALAKVSFDGLSFTTLPSAMAMGVVIAKSGTKVDILVDGIWLVQDLVDSGNFLETGETYIPGRPYYISPVEPGRITSRVPNIAVQMILGEKEEFVMSRVYSSPHGQDHTAKFPMGCRPVGDLFMAGNEMRLTGFQALQEDSGNWFLTSAIEKYEQTGFMVAEGWSNGITTPVWVEVTVKANGDLEVKQAATLTGIETATPDIYADPAANNTQPYAVTVGNHSDIRTLEIRDASNDVVYTLKFKFVVADGEVFDFPADRKVLLHVPNSFMGWKELSPVDGITQIQPYYHATEDSDFPGYNHTPEAQLYYDTKADPGFVRNWPPDPIERTIVLMNGVEIPVSELVESGNESTFSEDLPILGVGARTLYWIPDFGHTQPWDMTYSRLVSLVADTDREAAKIPGCPAADGEHWYWTEATYGFEPYRHHGWVYSNRISVHYRTQQVRGVGVLPPLRLVDSVTGVEPVPGQPGTGHLLITLDQEETVTAKTTGVKLSDNSTPYTIFENNTARDVVLKDISFAVISQNGSQVYNADVGVSFSTSDSAVVTIGTGSVGNDRLTVTNWMQTNVYDWNTSATHQFSNGARIIPPGGKVMLFVHVPFAQEQTVTVLVTGKTL